jgi:predicted nucleotidyltransferase
MVAKCDPGLMVIARQYINVLRENGIQFESAWLFGSSTKGRSDLDSDIDIAVIMPDVRDRFFKEVELVKYRRKIDTRIEPHILAVDESDWPFGREVMRTGIKIV